MHRRHVFLSTGQFSSARLIAWFFFSRVSERLLRVRLLWNLPQAQYHGIFTETCARVCVGFSNLLGTLRFGHLVVMLPIHRIPQMSSRASPRTRAGDARVASRSSRNLVIAVLESFCLVLPPLSASTCPLLCAEALHVCSPLYGTAPCFSLCFEFKPRGQVQQTCDVCLYD